MATVVLETISELSQGPKIRPRRLRFQTERRNRHQTSHKQLIVATNHIEETANVADRDSRLLVLITDIDLQQDLKHTAGPVLLEEKLEPIGEFRTIEGVHHIKGIQRNLDLVALQRSNEVPTGRSNSGLFCLSFLHPVFPEIGGTRCDGEVHHVGRMGFGYRDQSHGCRVAISGLRCRIDPVPH